jgi:proteasome lid subunit RPN8/RPN11
MIALSADREDAIRREGERAYPNECCGIILGRIADDNSRVAAEIGRASCRERVSRHV